MKRLFRWLPHHRPQPATVDVAAEIRAFGHEIRELRHLFELQIARQASETTLRDCHTQLEQIKGLMIAWQEREAA